MLSKHHLICDDSKGIIVACKVVILPKQNLRSSVTWSTTGVLRVVFIENSGKREIRKSEIAFLIKENIGGTEIPMDNLIEVDVLEDDHQ